MTYLHHKLNSAFQLHDQTLDPCACPFDPCKFLVSGIRQDIFRNLEDQLAAR